MGIQANGNISQKNKQKDWKWEYFLSNETVLSTQTLQNIKMGIQNSLQVIREQMGIRENGNIPEISCILPLNGIPFARERTVLLGTQILDPKMDHFLKRFPLSNAPNTQNFQPAAGQNPGSTKSADLAKQRGGFPDPNFSDPDFGPQNGPLFEAFPP